MIFHSIDFLVFFIVVLTIYWTLSRKLQNGFLIAASYFFYGYVTHWWVILLVITTFLDFFAAQAIEDHPKQKRLFLAIILAANFGLLASLKYCNFFTENLAALSHLAGVSWMAPTWKVLLPVGISFYTFQSCAYVVDVYRGQFRACRKLLDYASYLCFFPQLVAGPIERAGHMLVQFEKTREFDWIQARNGLFLIIWGLCKKRVIADNVAIYCNKAFALSDPSFPIIWSGTLCFCVQIYADFSAYTDIARGVAKLLGFDLMLNFNHPYSATSPSDFWRRWHISLSNWFRDYVFIPLGGSRCNESKIVRNLLLTFLLSGLWHGASWNFILWGAWHGLALVIWRWADTVFPRWANAKNFIPVAVKWGLTFTMVNIGWLMFREQNTARLLRHFQQLPWKASIDDWRIGGFFATAALLFSIPLIVHALLENRIREWLPKSPSWPLWIGQTALAILLLALTLIASNNVTSDFIYFQF